MLLTICLLALLSVGHSLEVHHVLGEDNSRSLSCSSPSPWFFCVWEGPRGDRLCSLRGRQGDLKDGACGYDDSRLELVGNATHCLLVMRDLDITDQGDWTCALTDDNMETVKQVTSLNIIQHGNISLEVAETGERDAVQIFDGERLDLSCRLEQVWPAASLQWSLERDGVKIREEEKEELEVIFGEEETVSECELCPVTVQQRLTLSPQSGHSGLVVSCHHQTSGHSGLHVTVITPTQADLERLTHSQGLGLVPGILISSILVLLSLAVLISFCIRGSRNRKQKQSHTESEDPELGKSFVENENIVKGGGGVTDVIEKVYDEDANKDASFTDSSIHSSEHSDTNTSDSVSPSDGDKDKQERA